MDRFKRILSFGMAVVLFFSCLPATALQAEAAEIGEEVEVSEVISLNTASVPDNDALYSTYLENLFYGGANVSPIGILAREELSAKSQQLYDFLKENLQKVAAGENDLASFTVTYDQLVEWDSTAKYSVSTAQEALSAFAEEFEINTVVDALLHDCPYELYWFDKVTGLSYGATMGSTSTYYRIKTATFSFKVVADHQPADYDSDNPTVDTSMAVVAAAAAANAQQLVTQHHASDDYSKLLAYKDAICDLVSYNSAAASGSFSTDSDPWQLVYVFDNDPGTNVVCEGYAKAFQYLCDMSVFSDTVNCYAVTGDLVTSGGYEGHMWNIVTLRGKNYLVDVTNSDTGTSGSDGSLFLAGANGSIEGGYVIGSVGFSYDYDMLTLWGTGDGSILKLAESSYAPTPDSHTHTYTSTVTAPTCTEKGYTTYTCECGESFADNYVDATRHYRNNGICINCGDALNEKKVSILSHSISTYAGVSNNTADNSTIGNNDVYYTEGRLGVYRKDIWWQQTIDALGMELLVNNSWSGSCIFTPRKGEDSVGYGDRAVNLHNDHTGEEPDIIFVYLGCNDFAYYKDTFGKADDVDYAALIQDNGNGTYAYAVPTTACEAYAIMLHKVENRYSDAEIYCMTSTARRETDYTSDTYPDAGQPTEYSAQLQQIAAYFGYPVIDLETAIPKEVEIFDLYMGDKRAHPNALGMDQITNEVLSVMLGKDAEICHVNCEDGTVQEQAVLLGGSYRTEVALQEGFSLVVAMGGQDITADVFTDGIISIETVTGDIVIHSKIQREPLNFRWETQNDALVSLGDDNTLTQLSGSIADGTFNEVRYQLGTPVALKHDLPWELTWQCSGNWRGMMLSSDPVQRTDGMVYLARTIGGQLCFGTWTGSQHSNYGVDLSGLDSQIHTYRLENRIAADGSNMIWLYLDEEEIGPMNHYYIGSNDQSTTSDWISGKDFVFNYIGAEGHPVNNCALEYIQVLENGHTHNYESTTTAPTCTEQGYTTYTCSCGDSYVDSYIAAPGHTYDDDTDADCNTCGYVRDIEIPEETTPPTEPDVTEPEETTAPTEPEATEPEETTAPTEPEVTEPEETTAPTEPEVTEPEETTAPTEPEVTEPEETTAPTEPHIHEYESEVTAPSCTEQGYTTYTCSCGDSYEGDYTDALGHTEETIPGKDATCSEGGLTEGKKCTICGEITVAQEVIEAKGHTEETVPGKDATCTESGLTEGKKCSVCGEITVAQEAIEAKGHTEEIIPGQDASCTESGLTEGQKCTVCGEILIAQEPTPATGVHIYENGTCRDCGEAEPNQPTEPEETVPETTEPEVTEPETTEPTVPETESTEPEETEPEETEPVKPAAPKITGSNVASSGKPRLTWNAVEGAVKYQIYRSTSKNGTYKLMYTQKGTTYTNTKAEAGQLYYYKVKAVDADGNKSDYSNRVSRTCDLPRPANVKTTNVASSGKIKLTWTKVAGAKSYKVYRATSKTGKYTLMKTVTGTTYTNTSAKAGTRYYYKVRAVHENSNANSAYSSVVSRLCDLARPTITVKRNSSGTPRISWEKVDGAVKYEVWRATSKNGKYYRQITTKNTYLVNKSAVAGRTYYYKVRAIHSNTNANSAYSTIKYIKAK